MRRSMARHATPGCATIGRPAPGNYRFAGVKPVDRTTEPMRMVRLMTADDAFGAKVVVARLGRRGHPRGSCSGGVDGPYPFGPVQVLRRPRTTWPRPRPCWLDRRRSTPTATSEDELDDLARPSSVGPPQPPHRAGGSPRCSVCSGWSAAELVRLARDLADGGSAWRGAGGLRCRRATRHLVVGQAAEAAPPVAPGRAPRPRGRPRRACDRARPSACDRGAHRGAEVGALGARRLERARRWPRRRRRAR